MIEPICEKGKVCVYLKKEIREYSYPLKPRSSFMIEGKELVYSCNNPKKYNEWRIPKELNHEEKFRMCKYKVTNKLEEFIKG